MPIRISIIVSTYNAAGYLNLALEALNRQSDLGFEVVVADDGSGPETNRLLSEKKTVVKYPLIHAWHEDLGFRAAAARNNAVSKSSGDYLVFLDGDCLALPSFIARHKEIADPSWMVRGSRVMLSQAYTHQILKNSEVPPGGRSWLYHRFKGNVNRVLPLLRLPYKKKTKSHEWYGVKTCNLGIWREDFEAVNGFDESYVGWGHEDADLAVRLIRNGIRRKEGRSHVPVIHLWHEENSRDQLSENEGRLQRVIGADYVWAENGLDRH